MSTSVAPADGPKDSARFPAVTVVGLGEMGSALAGAFLDAGYRTTVWNRTPERAADLVSRGAFRADEITDAVSASPLVVVNVANNAAALEVLGNGADALGGRALVNLADGTSEEARRLAGWASARGADYVHGQIMTIAPGIGHDDSLVFYGGSDEAFATHESTLRTLAGRTVYLGEDPGVPSLYGMAIHDVMWGMLNGFLHALALLASEKIDSRTFLRHAGPSLDALADLFPAIGEEVDSREHHAEYGSLRLHMPSVLDLLKEESAARGIDTTIPERTSTLIEEAISRGHAHDSYSRLVDLLASSQPHAAS